MSRSKLLHNMSDLLSSFGAGREQTCRQGKVNTSNFVAKPTSQAPKAPPKQEQAQETPKTPETA